MPEIKLNLRPNLFTSISIFISNNSELPKKTSKKNPFTKNDKKNNRRFTGERVVNENVIGMLKQFKIIADKYRNRRKRFGLRFNLISGIYNFDLP